MCFFRWQHRLTNKNIPVFLPLPLPLASRTFSFSYVKTGKNAHFSSLFLASRSARLSLFLSLSLFFLLFPSRSISLDKYLPPPVDQHRPTLEESLEKNPPAIFILRTRQKSTELFVAKRKRARNSNEKNLIKKSNT